MSHRFFLKNLYDFSYSVFNEHSLNFRQGHLAFTKLLRYLNLFKYLRRSVISPKELFSFFLGSSGLEPPTSRLSGARSNQLSYEPVDSVHSHGSHPLKLCRGVITRFHYQAFLTGDDGIRTHDPLLAGQVLSQLSYTPIWFRGSISLQWAFISHWKLNNNLRTALYSYQITFGSLSAVLLRKEVIQPHLPIRLPCYDLTPIIEPTFGHSLLAVRTWTSGVPDFHGLTGGVYKARERIHRGMLIRDY